jgi:pyruvate dehydrogenase E1 component beta subunit
VVRPGSHVTVIAWGAMLYEAIEAANQAAAQGDRLRGARPAHPLARRHRRHRRSVKKTGRVVVVHEAPKTCGFGAELVALINEKAFLHLEAPPVRVTGWDTPFPYTGLRDTPAPYTPRDGPATTCPLAGRISRPCDP